MACGTRVANPHTKVFPFAEHAARHGGVRNVSSLQLVVVADIGVPCIDGWKTDMELVFKKAFVMSELLNVEGAEVGADGAEVAGGGLGIGTKDWYRASSSSSKLVPTVSRVPFAFLLELSPSSSSGLNISTGSNFMTLRSLSVGLQSANL